MRRGLRNAYLNGPGRRAQSSTTGERECAFCFSLPESHLTEPKLVRLHWSYTEAWRHRSGLPNTYLNVLTAVLRSAHPI
jgi:hypothetical protein